MDNEAKLNTQTSHHNSQCTYFRETCGAHVRDLSLSFDLRDRLCQLLRIVRAAVLECTTCNLSAHYRTFYHTHSGRTQFINCDSDSDLPCKRMFFGHPTESTKKHQSSIYNMDSETFLMSSVKYIKNKRSLHFSTLEI